MDTTEGKSEKSETNRGKDDSSEKGSGQKRKKELPDIAKMGNARPTKIPRTARHPEEIVVPGAKVNWRLFNLFGSIPMLLILIAFGCTIWGGNVFSDSNTLGQIQAGLKNESFWPKLISETFSHPLSQSWVTATYAWDLSSSSYTTYWVHFVNLSLHFSPAYTCIF